MGSADLQVGCSVGLQTHRRYLVAWTPPVQPTWKSAQQSIPTNKTVWETIGWIAQPALCSWPDRRPATGTSWPQSGTAPSAFPF